MELRLSSFEIRALVEETSKEIKEAHLEKAQQIGPELFRFSFSTKAGKRNLLVEIGKRFNLTRYSLKAPHKPSMLSTLLRKHLENKRLKNIEQYEFDRVVILDFNEYRLILEFFSHGNMILTDETGKIILTFRGEEWKDRTLKKGQKYVFPKGAANPVKATLSDFKKIFEEKDAVRTLARAYSFGGQYAEEICSLAGVDKNKKNPSDAEKKKLYSAMQEVLARKPSNLTEKIDETYVVKQEESLKLKKLRKRLEEQMKALGRFNTESKENKEIADRIYKEYALIESKIRNKKGKVTVELD